MSFDSLHASRSPGPGSPIGDWKSRSKKYESACAARQLPFKISAGKQIVAGHFLRLREAEQKENALAQRQPEFHLRLETLRRHPRRK